MVNLDEHQQLLAYLVVLEIKFLQDLRVVLQLFLLTFRHVGI